MANPNNSLLSEEYLSHIETLRQESQIRIEEEQLSKKAAYDELIELGLSVDAALMISSYDPIAENPVEPVYVDIIIDPEVVEPEVVEPEVVEPEVVEPKHPDPPVNPGPPEDVVSPVDPPLEGPPIDELPEEEPSVKDLKSKTTKRKKA